MSEGAPGWGGVYLKGRMGEVLALEKRGRGVSTGWAVLALGGRGVSEGGGPGNGRGGEGCAKVGGSESRH